MATEGYVHVVVFANRNPKIDEQEFNHHWQNEHSTICAPWLRRHSVVNYSQHHTTSAWKDRAKNTGLPIVSYDGMAHFWYKTFEDFERAYEDQYYKDVVRKDEEYLFDLNSISITIGVDYCVIEDAKVVEEHQKGRI
ncbi:hypothetical protein ACN47E_008645 [Coniothyrium glycines]